MRLCRPRTLLELRVGTSNVVQVVLNVKTRQDITWYNGNNSHWQETLNLLRETIIPRVFSEDIVKHTTPELGPNGVALVQNDNNSNNNKKRKRKRKRDAANDTVAAAAVETRERTQNKDPVHWAIGQDLQIAYRLIDISSNSGNNVNSLRNCTTLMAVTNNENNNSTYKRLRTLNKQIVMWVMPITKAGDSDVNEDQTDGFCRPELIPIADLFRALPE